MARYFISSHSAAGDDSKLRLELPAFGAAGSGIGRALSLVGLLDNTVWLCHFCLKLPSHGTNTERRQYLQKWTTKVFEAV
jgi:hypothetical protein